MAGVEGGPARPHRRLALRVNPRLSRYLPAAETARPSVFTRPEIAAVRRSWLSDSGKRYAIRPDGLSGYPCEQPRQNLAPIGCRPPAGTPGAAAAAMIDSMSLTPASIQSGRGHLDASRRCPSSGWSHQLWRSSGHWLQQERVHGVDDGLRAGGLIGEDLFHGLQNTLAA